MDPKLTTRNAAPQPAHDRVEAALTAASAIVVVLLAFAQAGLALSLLRPWLS